jgi:hypothetical protein
MSSQALLRASLPFATVDFLRANCQLSRGTRRARTDGKRKASFPATEQEEQESDDDESKILLC